MQTAGDTGFTLTDDIRLSSSLGEKLKRKFGAARGSAITARVI